MLANSSGAFLSGRAAAPLLVPTGPAAARLSQAGATYLAVALPAWQDRSPRPLAFFRRRLAQAFPADGIISEEGEDRAGDADAVWIVDPLDGTRYFLHGSSHWCVSVALSVGRRPVIGLVYDPVLDELFAAMRGGGAARNGRPPHGPGSAPRCPAGAAPRRGRPAPSGSP